VQQCLFLFLSGFFFFFELKVELLLQISSIFLKKRCLIGSLVVLVKWFAAYLYVHADLHSRSGHGGRFETQVLTFQPCDSGRPHKVPTPPHPRPAARPTRPTPRL
jgi:hypothetical protein